MGYSIRRIYRDIFRAIHEGKWLKIEYKNKDEEFTKFWIGILDLNIWERKLIVDGLHIGKYSLGNSYVLSLYQIISSQIIEGSYCAINQQLVDDIYLNPHKYKIIFDNVAKKFVLFRRV